MDAEIRVAAEEGALVIAFGGEQTFARLEELTRRVAAECEGRDLYRVIVDLRGSHGTLDVASEIALGQIAASLQPVASRIRLAIVEHKSVGGGDFFFETVLVNRGIDARYFEDLEAARAWLRGG
jgi:hypothetical protein